MCAKRTPFPAGFHPDVRHVLPKATEILGWTASCGMRKGVEETARPQGPPNAAEPQRNAL